MKFLTPILYDPQLALSKEEQIHIARAVKQRFGSKGIARFLFPIAFVTWGLTVLAGFFYLGQTNIAPSFLIIYMVVALPPGAMLVASSAPA